MHIIHNRHTRRLSRSHKETQNIIQYDVRYRSNQIKLNKNNRKAEIKTDIYDGKSYYE